MKYLKKYNKIFEYLDRGKQDEYQAALEGIKQDMIDVLADLRDEGWYVAGVGTNEIEFKWRQSDYDIEGVLIIHLQKHNPYHGPLELVKPGLFRMNGVEEISRLRDMMDSKFDNYKVDYSCDIWNNELNAVVHNRFWDTTFDEVMDEVGHKLIKQVFIYYRIPVEDLL